MPRCTRCYKPLTRVEEDGLRSATCPECFGTWIASATLVRRLRLDVDKNIDTLAGSTLEDLIDLVGETDSHERVRCPDCGKLMVRGKMHPLIPVFIDRCLPCRGIWLDAGEFRLLRTLYKELMTSDDPELKRKLEKIGGAALEEAAWKARRERMHTDLHHGSLNLPDFGGFDLGDLGGLLH